MAKHGEMVKRAMGGTKGALARCGAAWCIPDDSHTDVTSTVHLITQPFASSRFLSKMRHLDGHGGRTWQEA